jgi:predicted AlkP superfamily pyrophosphatase or phosphodiesterase
MIASMTLKRLAISLVLASALGAQTPRNPKLVVAVVVDQFRYDYLTRFRSDYKGGFDRMLRQGAVFTNAHYAQAPTVTAVGHSIILSGAMPSVSGIVGNTWLDRRSGKVVTSVCDWSDRLVGAETPQQGARCTDEDPASPNRLLVSTVGDELRNRNERSKVFGISLKARSAILLSGHRANGAFWFDDKSGTFVSSTFYAEDLPSWVKEFNALKLPEHYVNEKWKGFESWDFHAGPKEPAYEKLPASPWANEMLERLAEKAVEAEKLGQGDATDLLTLSFSANDYVGHQTGPDAPEVRDMAIRTDQLLGKLMDVVAQRVGRENAVFVLSADHGVAPSPSVDEQRKMPGGYISGRLDDIVSKALVSKFGPGNYILATVDNSLYLNYKTLDEKKLDAAAVYQVARDALYAAPQSHVLRVFTRDQLSQGTAGDRIGQALLNGFNPTRSGDIILVFEPYYMGAMQAPRTTHFTPYNYDTHVPVIFYGAGVKAGVYRDSIEVNDIAPTLATILDIEAPSGAFGRILTEALEGE